MQSQSKSPSTIPDLATRNVIGWRGWALILGVALVLRLIVMASGAVSFHSDEAIVGLMARHINQGLPIPTFFYGQAYMGSLDALLISVSFRLFGESVLSIRWVESALYMLIVLTTVLLAKRVTVSTWAAIAAGLLIAVPPVLMTLYTSMTLGGYNETLLLGNIVLLIGWDLANRETPRTQLALAWRWALLGLVGGLGWWTDGLIVVYLLPVALYLTWRLLWPQRLAAIRYVPWIMLAGIMFVIGGLPWWLYNLSHNWDALGFLIGGASSGNGLGVSATQRILGLLFLGLPAVLGVRFPWTPDMWAGIGVGIVLTAYIAIIAVAIAQARRPLVLKAGIKTSQISTKPTTTRAARFMLLITGCTALLFVGSGFGVDATGRYLMPLIPGLAILAALCGDTLSLLGRRRVLGQVLIGGLLIVALIGNVITLTTIPPGLTSQFDPVTDFPNSSDQALIDFLLAHDGSRGFGTYWVTFRIAFASQERVILDAWLPYKSDLRYTLLDRRYMPYTEMIKTAPHWVYVTANTPQLNSIITDKFNQNVITFKQQTIGPYTVYYDLSAKVAPDALGLESMSLLAPQP
jgi:hypothetical protein